MNKLALFFGLVIVLFSANTFAKDFHEVKPVGNSTYNIIDISYDTAGLSVVGVKATGKTYSSNYYYFVQCHDTRVFDIKYENDNEYVTFNKLVPGSSMYNIARATCWMHYLAIKNINYQQYLIE